MLTKYKIYDNLKIELFQNNISFPALVRLQMLNKIVNWIIIVAVIATAFWVASLASLPSYIRYGIGLLSKWWIIQLALAPLSAFHNSLLFGRQKASGVLLALATVAVLVGVYFIAEYLELGWIIMPALASTLFVVEILLYLGHCFTYVAEGTSKQVMRLGAFRDSLLAKQGYDYNREWRQGDDYDEQWNLVKLEPGQRPQRIFPGIIDMGGLRWVSLLKPLGIDTIYSTKMKYIKSLPKGKSANEPKVKYDRREDEGTDFLLTGTQYPYALLFDSCEDKNGLPLSGQMTMTAMIVNPYRALFKVDDWYDALVSRVLPRVRTYISEHSYEDIIYKKNVQLDADVFEILNQPDKTDLPQKRSIVQILQEEYGIKLIALETVDVNPPEAYRKTSLQKWEAERRADAAKAVALAKAREASGPIDRAMDAWVANMAKKMGLEDNIPEALKILRERGEYERRERMIVDRINREGGTVQEQKFDIVSGGDPIDSSNLQTIVMGGSASTMVNANPSQNPRGKKGGKKGKKKDQGEDEDEEEEEEEEEDMLGL